MSGCVSVNGGARELSGVWSRGCVGLSSGSQRLPASRLEGLVQKQPRAGLGSDTDSQSGRTQLVDVSSWVK